MGLLDGILGQVAGNLDVSSIAKQVGLDPAMAEKAIAALGQAHPEPGDTVESASAATGIDSGTLGQIVSQIGGEGALGQLSGLLKENPQLSQQLGGIASMLDRDGDGNPLNDIAGIAGSLFGKN
ncbi:hypothetical protein [Novosphingobium sp.]|uniref:hypothetical protein n=1 Tax=Novosphingobium sp. TaxID=1874826 RepID=UPI0035AD7BA4